MKYLLLIASVLVVVNAFRYELVEDEEGQQYYMVPSHRSKRQVTKFDLRSPGIGTLSHSGTLLNNNNYRLDGTGYVAKDFRRSGVKPDAYGGSLDYAHKPSGLDLGLRADHIRRGGTDLKATGTWNFINEKNAKLGINGEYGRHFGSPGGTGRPDYGVYLKGGFRF